MLDFKGKYLMIVSDLHMHHKNIIEFERTQFKNIDEHDNFIIQKHIEWREKIKKLQSKGKKVVFINLGDFFDLNFLDMYKDWPCELLYIYGNHDAHENLHLYQEVFNYVFEYPIFISDRIILSHIPQNAFDSQIVIHGHLHGNIIDKPNYICCSINHINYKPITSDKINSVFGKIPKYTQKHLEAPYTTWEKVIYRPQNDLILDPVTQHIDVSAMRALQYINKQLREKEL